MLFGFYPDPIDDEKYYQCLGGIVLERSCTAGFFDADLGRCV